MEDTNLEITPAELKRKLSAGDPIRLVDVRETWEYDICRIEGSVLIPMNSIPNHLNSLDDDGPPIAVICHHGVRSLSVVSWLRRQGVDDCRSLAGGIDLWSILIDPSVPRY